MSDNAEPRPAKVPVVAGNEIRAIIPQSLEEAYRLAQAFVQGGIAPRGMQRPEQVMIAILAGLEVGLRPLQAIQGIYIVNGRPQLFGDTLVAIVRGSGRCKYIKEGVEGEGDSLRAWCETLRVGEDTPVRETFSWAQAKKAGLTGKEGPWSQYPARMLKTRARNFCLRDVYADVLRGLGNDLEEPMDVGDVTPPPAEPPSDNQIPTDAPPPDAYDGPPDPDVGVIEELAPDPEPPAPPDPEESEEVTELLATLTAQLKIAQSAEVVHEIWGELDVGSALTHDEDAMAMAESLRDRKLRALARKE